MTSAVCAILCRRVVQPPTARVCSGETSYRLRSPTASCHHCSVSHLRVQRCPSRRVENDSSCPDHKSQAHRLPDSDRQNTCCCCEIRPVFSRFSPSVTQGLRSPTSVPPSQECLETRTKETKHVCKFLGSRTRVEPTAIGGAVVRLWRHRRQHGWTCPQVTTFSVRTKESNTCVHFFSRMLGSVHDRQPTVIVRVSAMKR